MKFITAPNELENHSQPRNLEDHPRTRRRGSEPWSMVSPAWLKNPFQMESKWIVTGMILQVTPLPLGKSTGRMEGSFLSVEQQRWDYLPVWPMAHAVCCMFPTCFPCVPRGLSLLFHGFVHLSQLLQELAEIRGQRGCRSNKTSIDPYFSWQECCTRR